jgi:predicted ATP-grasp superfamily ATP-dependent carboligase
MRLRAFELDEPVPELNEPHALAILQPYVDVGNVGTMTLSRLESYYGAVQLAKLSRPGNFFDFTRYRPTLYFKEGRREIQVPNVTIAYAKVQKGHDFLFLRLLEPHMLAEVYIDSILQLFKRFGIKRYCLLGAMYDMIPYTRPLLVSGTASNPMLQKKLKAANVISSDYQGPTTIAFLISQQALQMGTETLSLIVHLPRYFMVENDYRGEIRLMEALGALYDFPMAQDDAEKAKQQEDQTRQIAEQMIAEEPRLRLILNQLEANYDSRVEENKEEVQLSPLSPEVEKFLQDLDRRFRQG